MIKRQVGVCDLFSNKSPRYSIVVDTRPASSELLNFAGWPMNDISLLMKLSSEGLGDSPLANQILNGLVELKSSSVDNSAKSNSDLIKEIIPKYVGSLGEYLKYLETLPLTDKERSVLAERAKKDYSDDVDDADKVVDDVVSDSSDKS